MGHRDGLGLFPCEQACIVYMHAESELLWLEGHFLLGGKANRCFLPVTWLVEFFSASRLLVDSISGDVVEIQVVVTIKERYI